MRMISHCSTHEEQSKRFLRKRCDTSHCDLCFIKLDVKNNIESFFLDLCCNSEDARKQLRVFTKKKKKKFIQDTRPVKIKYISVLGAYLYNGTSAP